MVPNLLLFSLIFYDIIGLILLDWNYFFSFLEQHEFYSPYYRQVKRTSARNNFIFKWPGIFHEGAIPHK